MAAEYRDEETGNHILRMSHMTALLAHAVGWNEDTCELMLNASPMHDIGKIGKPDAVLLMQQLPEILHIRVRFAEPEESAHSAEPVTEYYRRSG